MQFTKRIWEIKQAKITEDVYKAADAQFNALKTAMTLNYLEFQENTESRFVACKTNDEGFDVHLYINIEVEERLIICISILPITVDPYCVDDVIKACEYVTDKMYVGSFSYDKERNVISFNWQSVWNEHQEPSVEVFDLIINRMGYSAESYYEHFNNLATGVYTYDDFVFEVDSKK